MLSGLGAVVYVNVGDDNGAQPSVLDRATCISQMPLCHKDTCAELLLSTRPARLDHPLLTQCR